MSVMNGFRGELLDKIIGINGHAVIYLNQIKILILIDLVEIFIIYLMLILYLKN